MFIQKNLSNLPLNRRQIPSAGVVVTSGKPEMFGRILSLSEDKHTARAVWRMTTGAVMIDPDPSLIEVVYVLAGRAEIHLEGRELVVLEAGTMVEFPRSRYELKVVEDFKKIAFIYSAQELKLKAEPL